MPQPVAVVQPEQHLVGDGRGGDVQGGPESVRCRRSIATECYGTRDYVVHEQTGLLVPAGDATALRQAYDWLAADPALRQRLSAQARARSAQWGLSGFVERIDSIAQTLHTRK